MPSRCEMWRRSRAPLNQHNWAGVCASLLCLLALGLPAFSADTSNRTAASDLSENQTKTQLCDNTAYDGASLPAPVKKKNQVVVGSDDGTDDSTTRKNRHKRQVEVDTASDSISAGDASLPTAKKVARPQADTGKVASDKEKEPRFGPGGDRHGNHDAGGVFGKGPLDLTALSLTDEQKQKIAQMHSDNGAKMRDLMRKRRDLTNQMRDLMFDADVNESQIRAKRDEVRQVQEKLEDLRLNDFLSIRSLLTAEQRQKLKDVKLANRPHDDGPPPGPGGPPPKRTDVSDKEKNDQKRLADTPNK
jgi:Spy/CpxP family protein refolding chaperone